MKYSEFTRKLTGTDPVRDAHLVRNFTTVPVTDNRSVYMPYRVDLSQVFTGLLIKEKHNDFNGMPFLGVSDEGAVFANLEIDNGTEQREENAKLIGLWARFSDSTGSLKEGVTLSEMHGEEEDLEYINAFALELLMPAPYVRKVFEKDVLLCDVAEWFDVEAHTLRARLISLELL